VSYHLLGVTLFDAAGATSTFEGLLLSSFSRFRCRSLSQNTNSASFAAVAQYLHVFGGANRPEFRIFDLLIPWIFVISVMGFLAAWVVVAILERTGLSRHIWHLPLFFLALVVLLSSIIGFVCFP
jgi:Protein of unknown function (DUF1656)